LHVPNFKKIEIFLNFIITNSEYEIFSSTLFHFIVHPACVQVQYLDKVSGVPKPIHRLPVTSNPNFYTPADRSVGH